MSRSLAGAAWLVAPASRAVLAAFGAGGVPARFVGGCVRDGLLGLTPQDIDLATPARPELVLELAERAGLKAIPTGLAHGTVTILADIGAAVEVTTLRRDIETDGRHAVVAFTEDWAEDARRRDFTINALYADSDGTLFDPVGGLADLEAGRVRFIGVAAERIAEDYLRILRFFRFYGRFGTGAPDPEALRAIGASLRGLARLSAERVRDELLKILALPQAPALVELLAASGVLAAVLPEAEPVDLAPLVACEASVGGTGPWRRLVCLLGADPVRLEALASRLKLSLREADVLRRMALALERLQTDAGPLAIGEALYRLGAVAVADAALLAAAADEAGQWRRVHAEALAWQPITLPLRGADLLASGVSPGPAIGRLLEEVESWWLAGGMTAGRDACLAELERRLGQNGS